MNDTDIKHAICLHAVAIVNLLDKLDEQTTREACIYPTMCMIKEVHPEAFENALVFYLREGVVK